MTELLALGASHKTAPLALRERLALLDGQVEPFLQELIAHPQVSEAVAVSTCNRTELYVVVGEPVEAESEVLSILARRAGTRPTELLGSIYVERNCDAARHLFRVVSGLESMIIGEAEIQGQVKRAYERALHARTTGPLANKLFRAALATGKRVRTQTTISTGHASVASVAVDAARDAVGPLAERHVAIVGAGETAELTARAFHAQGVSTMFVANRHRDRAIALAERYGGASGSFDELPGELVRADVVVSSTASPHAIVGAEELADVMAERARRPLLLIDLAVPRDIDPSCAELEGVTLLDMDALQSAVRTNLRVRRAEAARAVDIVEDEIQRFAGWLGALEVMPTLGALRERGDAVVDGLLAENAGRWEGLSERDAERVEAFGRAIVKRLLHEPTQRVKELDPEHRHARLQLLRELFGLDETPAGELAESAEAGSPGDRLAPISRGAEIRRRRA
ncbi:glutamyl-tRNA reductase [Candidatus Solirubrobacter pratensis]|uniref:glutamyl-tRNA reductase n=1 Tax=Candidatus Solirubrobacter pratensis TaxID=1298857 RepID=UPI0003FDEF68|nr:glutamyl-tRNA reductase [Candidatus Solirubrobacter pratensis]